ncbi:MAG: ATP-binding protein [Spirochaetaceae bacterium]
MVENVSSEQVDPEIFHLFRQDGRRYLALLRRTLQEAGGRHLGPEERRKALRYAHSVKSEAAFLGYDAVAGTAHRIEDQLSGSSRVDTSSLLVVLGELEAAFDEALERVQEGAPDLARESEEEEPAEELLVRQMGPQERDRLVEARERGERLFVLECTLTEYTQMLAPRRFLLVSNLEQAVNLVVGFPEVQAERPIRRFVALLTTDGDRSEIEAAVDVDLVRLLRLEEIDYDGLLRRKDETVVSGMIAGSREVQVTMSVRSYEELCLYAGELHRQLEQLRGLLGPEETDAQTQAMLHTAGRLAETVDDTVARTSMVTLAHVFSAVESHARNLAEFLDKSVRVITSGAEHEVFLPVAEVLRNALLHLVRNAMDHGVEPPDERKAAGKDPTATVRVSAGARGDSLVIRVSDDGRGIPEEFHGIGNGGHGEDRGGDAALWEAVSRSGVSTRRQADQLSGRGVGLDVVRTQVERYIGGAVALDSGRGTGTTVEIHLPRAGRLLSILVARHGRMEFALPSAHVYAVFDLEGRYASRDHSGNLFYRYHGEAIRLYAVELSAVPTSVDGLRGILLRIGRRRAVVLAEEIVSQETVIRSKDHPERVFSQVLNRNVGLVFPVQFL